MTSEYVPTTEQVREAYATRNAPAWDVTRRKHFDRWLAQHDASLIGEALTRAIQAHRDLHPTYGSTAGCGGGIGGMVLTSHCALTCDNPVHDPARAEWDQVEAEYFEARREQA